MIEINAFEGRYFKDVLNAIIGANDRINRISEFLKKSLESFL